MFDLPFPVVLLAVMLITLIICLRRVNAKVKEVYSSAHDYEIVEPKDFPHLDLSFYDIMSANLQLEGFSFLANIEDKTLSSAYPNLRTFQRGLFSEDGIISATIYIVDDINGPSNVKTVDLATELSDGSFLLSVMSTQGMCMSFPPNYEVQYYSFDTPIEELIEIHSNRLALLLKEKTQVHPVIIKNLEDSIESAHRSDRLKSKHRKELGNRVTLKELFRIAMRPFMFVKCLSSRNKTDNQNRIDQEE